MLSPYNPPMAGVASVPEAERIAAIDEAFERHWRLFGLYPGSELRDEDGVLWFESPIAYLPYNAVIRTRIGVETDVDRVVARTAHGFHARNVPFMWVWRPTDKPPVLDRSLALAGLDLVETAYGMDLDLEGWTPDPDNHPANVVDVDASGGEETGLRDYEELIRTYWAVPDDQRHLIRVLNRHYTSEHSPGFRLVAYIDGHPVGKLFGNTQSAPDWLSVFGVAVRPEARGKGVARQLMDVAMSRAQQEGVERVVLHSSSMARSMYRRMGFTERYDFHVYATGPLFGTHHH
jgi:ribosomal protein S18 acetylase RimI-like enzyme